MMVSLSQLRILGEEVGSEFHGSLHVPLDLHLSLHECSLGLKGPGEEGNCVFVNKRESGISCSLLALLDRPSSILQIDGPYSGGLSLCGSNLEVIDVANLLNEIGAMSFDKRTELIEEGFNFEGHDVNNNNQARS